ncbi:MAG: relaxase/mobilization nuclease domain-containing protein [Clostridiales bacterium]|nr:relaxase/mobilization nuclease domain-containing protein [Clostridiales bacterium]
MAYIKIIPIKEDKHLLKAMEYILRKEKTRDGELVDSFYCQPDWFFEQFKYIRSKEIMNKGNNIAWQLYQSFDPEENITPEQALEIGKELMRGSIPKIV